MFLSEYRKYRDHQEIVQSSDSIEDIGGTEHFNLSENIGRQVDEMEKY